MKNTKNIFAAALMAMTVVTFANAADEKAKTAVVVNTLPANVPALETPAPQVAKNTTEINNKYNANQKAAIVELTFKK
ncbi:hypothetical protein DSL64_26165 [Dyadobacter luteus]|jgi:hypothetical protein|uniref:Uncharacterized protein n=1 Tax=Dyadobacter luteus TaxID=2259619 RepID=A0A3D8Y3I3_9BACT|nr:hypothetical protein [Dyadobacter luteus]REA56611.1 hypothetical protein DSL64_26165 [Dyadobacter luteus]